MRKRCVLTIQVLVSVLLFQLNMTDVHANFSNKKADRTSTSSHQQLINDQIKLPMYFEKNIGQSDQSVKYLYRGSKYSMLFTPSEVVFSLHTLATPTRVKMKLVGADSNPKIVGVNKLQGKVNYFLGKDPKKWYSNISTYQKVKYEGIYRGVDLVWHGNKGKLEFDFIVAPSVDPSKIRIDYEGISNKKLDDNGHLILNTLNGDIIQNKPRMYQVIKGKKTWINGNYIINEEDQIQFFVDKYDPTLSLVIDPHLDYSSYLGSHLADNVFGLTIDKSGNIYVAGHSSDWLGTPNRDVFVAKLNSTGSSYVYYNYFGGSNADEGHKIKVDDDGNAYIVGSTNSADFPTTQGAYQRYYQGDTDIFVMKINSTGSSILFSTYLGGESKEGSIYIAPSSSIAIDDIGNAYLTSTTDSINFPTTMGAYQTTNSGTSCFVTKLNSDGSSLEYSTYLGGGRESCSEIAVDNSLNAYVTGTTASVNFPTSANAFQKAIAGSLDAFVTKLNSAGSSLVYSTFLGGSNPDYAEAMDVDKNGNVYLTGQTGSPDFPLTLGAFQTVHNGDYDVFIAKLNNTGSNLLYSTFLGGSNQDTGYGITVDVSGGIYVTGRTESQNFPITPDALRSFGSDAQYIFFSKLDDTFTDLVYSTCLVGTNAIGYSSPWDIELDSDNNVYLAGNTDSDDLPITSNAVESVYEYSSGFISKFNFSGLFNLHRISPLRGGDTGSVTATIIGDGFQEGVTTKLVSDGIQIEGTDVIVGDYGTSITAVFNLIEQPQGLWDLVVTNPDGASKVLEDVFAIEAGELPQMWVDIIGRNVIAQGRPQSFNILYGNRGNIDSSGAFFWIGGIPLDAEVELDFELSPPPDIPVMMLSNLIQMQSASSDIDWSQIPDVIETTTEKLIPIYIPWIPPDYTGYLKINLTTQTPFLLTVWTPPYVTVDLDKEIADCVWDVTTYLLGYNHAPEAAACILSNVTNILSYFAETQDWSNTAKNFGLIAIECTDLTGADLVKLLNKITGAFQLFDTCKEMWDMDVSQSMSVSIVSSFDPNDKFGSEGVGTSRYISGAEPLRYSIFFENLETATAPAQEVIITDQLDTANLDLNTFSFGPIVFGDKLLKLPQGLNEYETEVDLRPECDLIVKIKAMLDTNTGIVTWQLTSLDPETGEIPNDPLTGFLPPNVNPPEGEGSVLFTVMPKSGIQTGTQIRNDASIVFDVNEPIKTPEWLNTIDNAKPQSKVNTLEATQPLVDFQVEWSGTDVGAGIQDYTIFVSEDSGPFTPWLNTAETSAIFTGKDGKTYAFYSVARDHTGNVEDAPNVPDTTITVASHNPPVAQCQDVNVPTDPDSCAAAAASVDNGSFDPDGDPIILDQSPSGPYDLGTTDVTLTVTDSNGASNSCIATVTVEDTTAPVPDVAELPEVRGECSAAIASPPTATDNCAGTVTGTTSDPLSYSEQGTYTVAWTYTDNSGNTTIQTQTVVVEDTTPPELSITADPDTLWPPNHKMKPVTVTADASDNCDSEPTCKIVSVSSNEPEDGTGSGDKSPDWQITGDLTVNLRSERAGSGSGRIYTIIVEWTDKSSNSATAEATVTVPHDKGKKK